MKKIISLILVILITFSMVGCSTDSYSSEITDLENKIKDLESQNESKDSELSDLKDRLDDLENKYFDGVIMVSMIDEDGNQSVKSIRYTEEDEKTVFDILNENFEITYEETTLGRYLTSLDTLKPKYGAYISIYKNGQLSFDGIDTLPYEDGDVIEFKVEWWDQTEKAVDDAIKNFINNYASDYVKETYVDYAVGSALFHLGTINDYVSVEDMNSKYESFNSTSGKELFKAIIAVTAVGGNPTDVNGNDLVEQLVQAAPIGGFGLTAYSSLGLNAYNHDKDAASYIDTIITDLTTTNTPISAGPDMGGSTLIALSAYKDNTEVQTVIDEYVNYISTEQLESGGVEDMWTGENTATIAQVVLGLTANGIDPRSEQFTKTNGDLITRLLEFEMGDGSFKWRPNDESKDLAFSTPQAFAALVAYQQYKNTEAEFNIYELVK